MIETVLLAFLVAKLRKYKLKPIFKDWAIYPVIMMSIIYFYLQMKIFQEDYSLVKYTNIYKIIYLISLFIMLIKYKLFISGLVGSSFIVIGSILNNIVMKANNGKMPVFPYLAYKTGYIKPYTFERADSFHILGSESTKLKWLSDVIDVGYSIMSIGDVFVRVFAFLIIYLSIKYVNLNEAQKKD